jgi:hypothetical protein
VDESILFVVASWIVGMAFGYVSERFGARLTRAA